MRSIWEIGADALDPVPVTQEEVFARLGFVPTPKQWAFLSATETDVLYGGARGGGKSLAVVALALWAGIAYPGIRVAIYRRSYPELAESVIPALADLKFGEALGYAWNGSTSVLKCGRSIIRLRYLETIVDASRSLGGQYQLIILEERTQFMPGIVQMVAETLRTKLGSGVPVLGLRSTTNPGGASHSEVKTRYIEATNHGKEVALFCPACREQRPCKCTSPLPGETVRFIDAKVGDNPHVDPGYKARLMAIADPARRAAMLDGSWDSFGGQVFQEWRYAKHVIEPFALPPEWKRYLGVDYGRIHPWAAIWVAQDQDDRLWVYRELYESGVGERDQARRILEAQKDDPTPYMVGDPSMGRKIGDAESIMSGYLSAGVALEPANNDRLAGWSRLHDYLADGPACPHHQAHGLEMCPKLHVFSPCVNLIREIAAASYDNSKVEDVAKVNDDALDALRYGIMAIGDGASFFIPQNATKTTALDGSPLYTDFGPFAMPPREDAEPTWFTPK